MKKYLALAIIGALLSTSVVRAEEDRGIVQRFVERDYRNFVGDLNREPLPKIAERTDHALEAALKFAAKELRKNGEKKLANQIEKEYSQKYRGFLSRTVTQVGIGDHKPLNEWLAKTYDKIEEKLGVNFCVLTHLADIKTVNFAIPIVFRPCSFEMDGLTIPRIEEYKNHFGGDGVYEGLFCVVSYWSSYGVCLAATYGGGAIWFCGAISTGVELLAHKFVAYPLGEKIYRNFCE